MPVFIGHCFCTVFRGTDTRLVNVCMSGTDVYSIFSVAADHYSSVNSPPFGNTVEENASNSFVRYGSLAIFRKAHKSPSFDMCK